MAGSRSLGSLTLDLIVKTGQFSSGLDKAARDADKRFKAIKASAASFTGAFAAIGAGLSFGAIVQATAEAEKALANLNNAVQNNGGAVGYSTQQLADFSGELQKLTTYSDDAIQNMQALLLRFKGISGQEFTGATRAVLDLATGLQVDLQTAALQVGKALSDPEKGLTALQKAGVKFSDAQKKVIKDLVDTGDRAGAQVIILAELEKRFGGAAEAARNTFGGALEGLKNAFGDLLEAKNGLPGVVSSINELTEVLSSDEAQQSVQNLTGALIKGFSAVAKVVATVAGPIASLITKANDLGAVLDNKIFNKGYTEAEFGRIFGVGARGTGPSRRGNTPLAPVAGGDESDTKSLDKAKESIDKLIQSQRQQIDVYGKSATATIQYRITQGDLADEFKDLGDQAGPLGDKLVALTAQYQALQDQAKQKEAVDAIKGLVAGLQQEVDLMGASQSEILAYNIAHGDLAKQFALAGAGADEYRQQLYSLTTQLEVMKDAQEGADQAIADFSAANEASLEQFGDGLEKQFEVVGEKWTVFQDQLARNTQDIIADTLVNGFDDGLKGIYKSFADLIIKLTAQAVAADLTKRLFGSQDATGSSGSGFGGLVGAALGYFSGKAAGGSISAGVPYLVGERGPEIVVPRGNGTVIPNGGGWGKSQMVNVNFTLPSGGEISRKTQEQGAAMVAQGLARANRRNN